MSFLMTWSCMHTTCLDDTDQFITLTFVPPLPLHKQLIFTLGKRGLLLTFPCHQIGDSRNCHRRANIKT